MLSQMFRETIIPEPNKNLEMKTDTTIDYKSSIPRSYRLTKQSRDYIQELKDIMINNMIKQWTTPRNKKYLSVTEIITCPKQVWYKLKGLIKPEWLDYDKMFYLLDAYGRMGDAIHNYIYKNLQFDYVELTITDDENHIIGRMDIIDNETILDIKSSRNKDDVDPQLCMYYYLTTKIKGLKINKVGVWWVLLDTIDYSDMDRIKKLYPKYVDRANKLWNALQQDHYPEELGIDKSSCKYCLIENFCKSQMSVTEKSSDINVEKRTNQEDGIVILI